jgi:hypothetical protein
MKQKGWPPTGLLLKINGTIQETKKEIKEIILIIQICAAMNPTISCSLL